MSIFIRVCYNTVEIFIRIVSALEFKGKIWKFVYLWIAVVDRINHKKLYPPKQSCCEKDI